MNEFEDAHRGDRVFILGNGPSLNKVPFEKLTDEYTIALNRIDLLYDKVSWRPTYYVVHDFAYETDDVVYEALKKSVRSNLENDTTLFLSEPAKEHFGERDEIYYFNSIKKTHEQKTEALRYKNIGNLWSKNITEVIYQFGSTISIAAQIASYMGFDEIYFIGCDLFEEHRPYMLFKSGNDPHNYVTTNSTLHNAKEFILDSSSPIKSVINGVAYKFWKLTPLQMVNDPNHFSNDYAVSYNVKHKREANKKMSQTHQVIKIAGEKYGFDVKNATIGGYLEVYDRVDIHNIVN